MTREGVPGIDYLYDSSEEAIATSPSLAKRCKECPYTEGTEASKDATTARLARECAAERSAFFCHKTIVGFFPTHLCAGWLEAIEPTR